VPGPASGAGLEAVLAGLDVDPGSETRVDVTELHVVRERDGLWEAVGAEAAATASAAGVVAVRSCRYREGLSRVHAELASWYAFQDGRLVAFDHSAFDPGCRSERRIQPAPAQALDTERTLVRFSAQRHPGSALDAADLLRLGLALVEAGRLEEAELILAAGDRAVAEAADRRDRAPAEQHDALERRERELLSLRAALTRALMGARSDAQPGGSDSREGAGPGR